MPTQEVYDEVLRYPGYTDLPTLCELSIEQARTVADVLLRRTRLGLLAAPQLRTAESVAAVAEALGNELGWDSEGIAAEAGRWVADARREGIDPAAVTA